MPKILLAISFGKFVLLKPKQIKINTESVFIVNSSRHRLANILRIRSVRSAWSTSIESVLISIAWTLIPFGPCLRVPNKTICECLVRPRWRHISNEFINSVFIWIPFHIPPESLASCYTFKNPIQFYWIQKQKTFMGRKAANIGKRKAEGNISSEREWKHEARINKLCKRLTKILFYFVYASYIDVYMWIYTL